MCHPTIKIVVAGDVGTGKSNLVNFFVRSLYSTDFDPTIEETYTKSILIDDVYYNLEIIDTVDNEFRDNQKRNCMYIQSDVIILTYAIDDEVSFTNLLLRYSNLPINEEDGSRKLTYVDGRIKSFPPIILVGTKLDLESSRQVAYQSGKNFADQLKLHDFLECSSLANVNVDELFILAAKLGLEHQNSEKDLTHIYAADEESQVRSTELRLTSSTRSTGSRFSRDNVSKLSKIPDKFSSIKEQDLPASQRQIKANAVQNTATTNQDKQPHTSVERKPTNANLSSQNATQQQQPSSATRGVQQVSSKDGCCTIM